MALVGWRRRGRPGDALRRRCPRRDLAVSAGLRRGRDGRSEPVGAAPGVEHGPLRLVRRALRVHLRRQGGLKVDGQTSCRAGRENHSLGGGVPGRFGQHFPAAGRTPAAAMFTGAAVQHLDRDAVPTRPSTRCSPTCADLLDAGLPAGGGDDRRQVVDGLRRPGASTARASRTRRDDQRAARVGFTVMLWLVPFVSPDSETFRLLRGAGLADRAARRRARRAAVVERLQRGAGPRPTRMRWPGCARELDALVDDVRRRRLQVRRRRPA